MAARLFAACVLGLAASVAACALIPDPTARPCNAKPIPVKGSPSDYTLGAATLPGATVGAPVRCTGYANDEGQAIVVAGTGDGGADGGDAGAASTLRQRLDQRLRPLGSYVSLELPCKEMSAAPPAVAPTDDWSKADAIVRAVADELHQEDSPTTVIVVVREDPVACPD